jgi:hypothetical protein
MCASGQRSTKLRLTLAPAAYNQPLTDSPSTSARCASRQLVAGGGTCTWKSSWTQTDSRPASLTFWLPEAPVCLWVWSITQPPVRRLPAMTRLCPCAESRFSAFTDLVAPCVCISRSNPISTLPQEIVAPSDAIANWQFDLHRCQEGTHTEKEHIQDIGAEACPRSCTHGHRSLRTRCVRSLPISADNQLGSLIICCTSVCECPSNTM